MRSGRLRAAKSSITARKKEKVRMVAMKARPWAAACKVNTATRTKIPTSAAHRPSVRKGPSWQEEGKKKYKSTKVQLQVKARMGGRR